MITAEELQSTALLLVDIQEGFSVAAYWGEANNPEFDDNVAALLGAWQAHRRPVVAVRHDSREPGSPLHPDRAGNALRAPVRDVVPDLLVAKSVNSAFHGTPDLNAWLRANGVDGLVIAGITTNHCCETTARVGGNLGYRVWFPLDATRTYPRTGPDGTPWSADDLARVTAANLHREFATVTSTRDLVDAR